MKVKHYGKQWKELFQQEEFDKMALDANTQLLFHWIPIVLGLILMFPFGEGLGKSFSNRWPSLETKRGRTLGGMLLVMLGGFTVSVHTLWIHNKRKELGSGDFCSSEGLFDCSSVIGNDSWNTMPVLDIPWGIVGMLGFSFLLWIVISVAKDPAASYVADSLKYGKLLGVMGLFMILYLIYAEYEIGKLCQYCSTAHFAHLVATIGFFRLEKMYKTGEWGAGAGGLKELVDLEDRRERRKRGGYVKPTSEEE